MAKANALPEITRLAERHGFKVVSEAGSAIALAHHDRVEAFSLVCDASGAFITASWHAKPRMRTVVDKRAPGEYGKEGRALASNAKRRSVGGDEVRAEPVAHPSGLDVGYNELKRRIRTPNWLEGLK